MPILTHPPLFRLMEHLEFEQNRKWLRAHPLKVTGDILLVAGDTAYLDLPESGCDTYSQYSFWDWASEHYRQVIVCLGNHDFYGYYDLATMPGGYCRRIRQNVHAYYNAVVHIDNVDVIVSTLWSFIEPYNAYLTEKGVSDFYRIKYNGHRLTANDFNNEHERCLSFVKRAYPHSCARQKNSVAAPSTELSRSNSAITLPTLVLNTGYTFTRIATLMQRKNIRWEMWDAEQLRDFLESIQ